MSGHEHGLSVNGMLRILLAVLLSTGLTVWDQRSSGIDLPFLGATLAALVIVYGGWALIWYVRYRLRGRE